MIELAVIALVGFTWLLLVAAYRQRLRADWREPVLAVPVLIIESDDWGPGTLGDARRLEQLAALLHGFRDRLGQPPVLTVGVVLAAPGPRPPGDVHYVRRELDAREFAPIRRALLAGRDAGVFALQLHGMEHFWPPALERAAQRDPVVRAWLDAGGDVPRHENLPAALQSRWIDASRLPSTALSEADIEHAVADETACFAHLFGAPAAVAVPVTFVWTEAVEAAWARRGVRVIVTPGTRNIGRDGEGRLISDGTRLRNGDCTVGGVVYIVRDIYFEPALGHTAEDALLAAAERHRLGRPALMEMHRFNFTGDAEQAERSIAELRRLLSGALASAPDLRFMSTEALADALRSHDPRFVDGRLMARLRALVLRAATDPRMRKLAWASGLAVAALALLALASVLHVRSAARQRAA